MKEQRGVVSFIDKDIGGTEFILSLGMLPQFSSGAALRGARGVPTYLP